MTDPSVRVPAPPFSEDLLADLHAGVLDSETSEALWPLVDADPDAHAFVTSLDSLTRSLAGLDMVERTYAPIPDSLAERINSSLELEWNPPADTARADATVVPLRRRRGTWILGAAAAVAIAFVVVLLGTRGTEPASSVIAGPSTTAAPTVTIGNNPDPASLLTLIGSNNLGPLNDPSRLAGCRRANGIDDARALIGSGEVRIDGTPAVVLLLTGSQPRQITALTVGIDCSAGNPDTMSVTDIG